jgi:hypothetical protein
MIHLLSSIFNCNSKKGRSMPDVRLPKMNDVVASKDTLQGNAADLVNKDLVRAWLWWAIAWLTIFPLVGLLVSIKFHYPDFLGETSWLTFGRLRPVHVKGVIFDPCARAALLPRAPIMRAPHGPGTLGMVAAVGLEYFSDQRLDFFFAGLQLRH